MSNAPRLIFYTIITILYCSQASAFTLVTYNVWGLPAVFWVSKDSSRFDDIPSELANENVDLVAFQEAFSSKAKRMSDQLADLPYVATGPLGKGLKISSGLRVASRYPLTNVDTLLFNSCSGSDCFARKGAVFLTVNLPSGKEMDFVVTHANASDRDGRVRDSQMDELVDFIRAHERNVPLYVMGDFNFTDDSQNYERLTQALPLEDLWRHLNPTVESPRPSDFASQTDQFIGLDWHGATYNPIVNPWALPRDRQPSRIDYIFRMKNEFTPAAKSIKLVFNAQVNGRYLSDHFGLKAEIDEP